MESKRRRPYDSTRRAEQARVTRRRILVAAAELFEQRGYAATSVPAIAGAAGVSTGSVELLFGRKVAVLKEAIDVSIAGDDEPVAMLDRAWAHRAARAVDVASLLEIFAEQLRRSLRRSARLVHAAFEAAGAEPELHDLVQQLSRNRRVVAAWLVDALRERAPLRDGMRRADAIDTVWLFMEPSGYLRLVQYRRWTDRRFEQWFAATVRHTLTAA